MFLEHGQLQVGSNTCLESSIDVQAILPKVPTSSPQLGVEIYGTILDRLLQTDREVCNRAKVQHC